MHTLDLVVLAVEWGHGRRTGWLSNLHLGTRGDDGEFVMVGKTFKGLTDELLRWQTARLQELAIGDDGWVVHVRPELVVEIDTWRWAGVPFTLRSGKALGERRPLATTEWPAFDPALVVDDVIPYAVQVNGKLRAEIRVAADAAEADVRAAAEAEDKVKQALEGKTVRKFVFVPKRLVNFVVG